MSDLISRQDAIDALKALQRCECRERDPGCWEDACDAIKSLPSAERTGKWISDWGGEIKMVDGCPDGSCHCSNCGEWLVASDEYAVKGIYCPNCGCKMEGEQNDIS